VKAVIYKAFSERPEIRQLPDPIARADAVVLRVMASGVCLSDWHGWQGNDPDIKLPHVPGHELAGVVEAVGDEVTKWQVGDRVTVPFVGGCGKCPECQSGNHQVCDFQFQPGFTHWGSFAEYVAIHYADVNLVRLPNDMEFQTAASLGCRFATSFRAIVDQGNVTAGQWVVIHGCGGVGLSAIMIACALGANVVAVDISDNKLLLASELGAVATLNAGAVSNLAGGDSNKPRIPMDKVLANELQVVGSHGMQAHRYVEMLEMISAGRLSPEKLIGRTIGLDESIEALTSMGEFRNNGVTIITEF
jgi:alcohol dehydrogenase